MDIHKLLRDPIDMDRLGIFLEELHHDGRVDAIRSMKAGEQQRLFDAADGFRKITTDDVVPVATPALAEVICWGRNSLPTSRYFQKRFCRPDNPDAAHRGEIWGFNNMDKLDLSWATGPGYFVAYDLDPGEVLIDYTQTPPRGAAAWPRVRPNTYRLSRFIFDGMQDVLRGVSEHVMIGRARRDGQWMPNWFVLARQDPS